MESSLLFLAIGSIAQSTPIPSQDHTGPEDVKTVNAQKIFAGNALNPANVLCERLVDEILQLSRSAVVIDCGVDVHRKGLDVLYNE